MGVTCGLDFNVLRKPSSILIASFRKCQDKGGRSLNESNKNCPILSYFCLFVSRMKSDIEVNQQRIRHATARPTASPAMLLIMFLEDSRFEIGDKMVRKDCGVGDF